MSGGGEPINSFIMRRATYRRAAPATGARGWTGQPAAALYNATTLNRSQI